MRVEGQTHGVEMIKIGLTKFCITNLGQTRGRPGARMGIGARTEIKTDIQTYPDTELLNRFIFSIFCTLKFSSN
jgi:hypothetical protein